MNLEWIWKTTFLYFVWYTFCSLKIYLKGLQTIDPKAKSGLRFFNLIVFIKNWGIILCNTALLNKCQIFKWLNYQKCTIKIIVILENIFYCLKNLRFPQFVFTSLFLNCWSKKKNRWLQLCLNIFAL